jgi:hypothetical protein
MLAEVDLDGDVTAFLICHVLNPVHAQSLSRGIGTGLTLCLRRMSVKIPDRFPDREWERTLSLILKTDA